MPFYSYPVAHSLIAASFVDDMELLAIELGTIATQFGQAIGDRN
nr:hypothetical protein [Sphingobium sp. YR768]